MPADHTMYAVHPIPLSDVKAIVKHAPSFGWQYIIVVLINGLTLPPLYFSNGGVRALMAALKQVRIKPGVPSFAAVSDLFHKAPSFRYKDSGIRAGQRILLLRQPTCKFAAIFIFCHHRKHADADDGHHQSRMQMSARLTWPTGVVAACIPGQERR